MSRYVAYRENTMKLGGDVGNRTRGPKVRRSNTAGRTTLTEDVLRKWEQETQRVKKRGPCRRREHGSPMALASAPSRQCGRLRHGPPRSSLFRPGRRWSAIRSAIRSAVACLVVCGRPARLRTRIIRRSRAMLQKCPENGGGDGGRRFAGGHGWATKAECGVASDGGATWGCKDRGGVPRR